MGDLFDGRRAPVYANADSASRTSIFAGERGLLAREYGLYFRTPRLFEHAAGKAARAASLGKSTNELKGDLTALAYLLSKGTEEG